MGGHGFHLPGKCEPGRALALGPAPPPGSRRGVSAGCLVLPGWVSWSRQVNAAGMHSQHPSQHPCSPTALLSTKVPLGRDRPPLGMPWVPGTLGTWCYAAVSHKDVALLCLQQMPWPHGHVGGDNAGAALLELSPLHCAAAWGFPGDALGIYGRLPRFPPL